MKSSAEIFICIVLCIVLKIFLEIVHSIGDWNDMEGTEFLLLLVIIFLGIIVKIMRGRKKKVERLEQLEEEKGLLAAVDGKHIKGLELHKYWSCELQFFEKELTLFRESSEGESFFTIPVESMKQIVWAREEELEKLYLTEQGALEGGVFFDSVEELQESSRKRILEYIVVIVYRSKKTQTYHFIAFDVAGKEREVENMIKGTWVLG